MSCAPKVPSASEPCNTFEQKSIKHAEAMYNPYLMNGALTTGGRGALSGARGGGAEREAERDAGSDLRGRRGRREHEQREQREEPC